jgi:hypothetical protein
VKRAQADVVLPGPAQLNALPQNRNNVGAFAKILELQI